MTSSTNPTETISQEAIEAAAIALFDYDEYHWETHIDEWGRSSYRSDAQRALAAAFPALRAQIETEDRAKIEAVEALLDAADEASLRPDAPDFDPIEIPWTVAVRAALGKGGRS